MFCKLYLNFTTSIGQNIIIGNFYLSRNIISLCTYREMEYIEGASFVENYGL